MVIEGQDWVLASSVWKQPTGTSMWMPCTAPGGRSFSDRLTAKERTSLIRTSFSSVHGSGGVRVFPLEFAYSPDTGERLAQQPSLPSQPWSPPFGGIGWGQSASDIRGLRQATLAITARSRLMQRRPSDEPGHVLPCPPPGQYEFVVGRYGADVDVLLAIDPSNGGLFAWLAEGRRWEALDHDDGGVLADTHYDAAQWDMEFFQEGADSTLFVSTSAGLALVRPNVISLSYSVLYLGEGPAIGPPRRWGDRIWVPIRNAEGRIMLLSCSLDGAALETFATPIPAPERSLGAAVCDARKVMWPSEDGQLVVTKGVDGKPQPAWIAWPSLTRPAFSFGCPYLSTMGQFWQLCWSQKEESYVYVLLGREQPEVMHTNAPAFCSGRRGYKMATAMHGDLWEDPLDASHASSTEVVIPLVESVSGDVLLGLVAEAGEGVTALLESNERHRVVLLAATDSGGDARFLSIVVSRPWRVRTFFFDGVLWVYHPELRSLPGTQLEA